MYNNRDFGWLIVLGFNGFLRQYLSLYRQIGLSLREGERKEKKKTKQKKNTKYPTRAYCKRNRPLAYDHPNK